MDEDRIQADVALVMSHLRRGEIDKASEALAASRRSSLTIRWSQPAWRSDAGQGRSAEGIGMDLMGHQPQGGLPAGGHQSREAGSRGQKETGGKPRSASMTFIEANPKPGCRIMLRSLTRICRRPSCRRRAQGA